MISDPEQRYEAPVISNAFNIWLDVHAPIDLVFTYLTGEQELSSWWATKCSTEPKPGGKLHFVWDGEKIRTGDAIFRQFEPPHRLVIEWTHGDGREIARDGSDPRGLLWPPLNIYNLAMLDSSRTRLHLHDLGIHAGETYEDLWRATQQGWREALVRLKRVVETRHAQTLARGMRRPQNRTVEPAE